MTNQLVKSVRSKALRGKSLVLPGPAAPQELDDSPKREVWLGSGIAFFFFVVLIGWAAIARLDAAAMGQGQVSISGNRQTVQHRDGGVVQALNVQEGQHVKAGDVLIKLTGSEVAAQERAYASTVISLQAQKARLEAEVTGSAIIWPATFTQLQGEDQSFAQKAMALQLRQFTARRASIASTRAVLSQQAREISKQTGGITAQAAAVEAQRNSLQQQLASTQALADRGFASTNTVRAIQRQIAQLEGAAGDYSSRAATANEQIIETRVQTEESNRKYIENAAVLLRDTDFQLNEALPKWLAARDQLERTTITAPVTGRVVGLTAFTVGGVIGAGQKIMDIVPDAAPLVVRANFSPTDIDGVYPGLEAEVKFLSLHERDLPILLGSITTVSADSLHDEKTGQTYFTAEIAVPPSQIALLTAVRGKDTGIRPGVPVQAIVKLRKRTALQYLLDPLTEAFSKSLHER